MKRILALALTVLLISSTLFACTNSLTLENDKGTAQESQSDTQKPAEDLETDVDDSAESKTEDTATDTAENTESLASDSTSTTESESQTQTETETETQTETETETQTETETETQTETDAEPRPLTKFEIQFSVNNEERLAKILKTTASTTNVSIAIPELSISPIKQANAGNNALTYVYSNASLALYDECCDKLYARNFAQYTETEFNGTAYNSSAEVKNYFTTFVSHNVQIDIELHSAVSLMYVTATPRTESSLPAREAPAYKKPSGDYPMLWTYFGLEDFSNGESSLGYIVRIADGSFIILDSGEYIDGVEDRIYQLLKKQAPDPDNVVISSWILTHAHSDHVGGYIKFVEKYVNDTTINLKQVVHNFPDDSKINETQINWQKWSVAGAKNFHSKPEILKAHTGNVLYYPGIKINVLYSQENYLAISNDFKADYNCSSLVTQFVTEDGTKILVGTDHPVNGSYAGAPKCDGALYKWYGSFIESDAVSAFHHGYGGGADSTIYYVIKASLVLLPCDQNLLVAFDLKSMNHNKYFLDMQNRPDGVSYYTARNRLVGVITFAKGRPILECLKCYEELNDYLNS